MHPVEFHAGSEVLLERVRPLWEQLNRHHHHHARAFRQEYEAMTFEDRKIHFLNQARAGGLRIDLARDTPAGRDIGYCVSSLSATNDGEIESIFVEEEFRGRAIGSRLVRRALDWMRGEGAGRIRVSVADGNESAGDFYRRFGFAPRMTVFQIPPDLSENGE